MRLLLRLLIFLVLMAIVGVIVTVGATASHLTMVFGTTLPELVAVVRSSVTPEERVPFLVAATGAGLVLGMMVMALRPRARTAQSSDAPIVDSTVVAPDPIVPDNQPAPKAASAGGLLGILMGLVVIGVVGFGML